MKAFSLDPGDVTATAITGRVLCHDIVSVGESGRVKLGKGHLLTSMDATALQAFADELHLIEMEEGDIHEDEASVRLARAISGIGVEFKGPVESQTHLRAAYRGLLEVNSGALELINQLPDVSIFTFYDGQPVTIDRAVAAAKVTPLVIQEAVIAEAEAIASKHAPIVSVRPFVHGPVGVVVRDRLTGSTRAKFESAIHLKVGWFGSPVLGIEYVPEDEAVIAAAFERFVAEGAVLILAAGVNSRDPLDRTIRALEMAGARTEKRGVPAHPGSTCWLAAMDDVPVFGLALCGMFSMTTVLDLLLPRFLSGRRVSAAHLATLGHGGLLSREMGFRFPNYADGTS